MQKLTREWLRKARADLRGAHELMEARPPVYDLICFHCQQCVEKLLKAMLQELGASVPRTHDLEDLLALILPHDATLKSIRRGLKFLSAFAVDYRYPGQTATGRQAKAALRWAQRLDITVRERLA